MAITETLTTQVKSLVDDVKGLPQAVRSIDVADLQKQAQGLAQVALSTATTTYAGEGVKKTAEDLFDKAETKASAAVGPYVGLALAKVGKVTGRSSAPAAKAETVKPEPTVAPAPAAPAAEKVAKPAAKKAPASKPAAKPAAKKAPVAKKAPASKPAAKPAAKKAPAKKAPVKPVVVDPAAATPGAATPGTDA
jgi:heparin binding hemagglutinin HbhA